LGFFIHETIPNFGGGGRNRNTINKHAKNATTMMSVLTIYYDETFLVLKNCVHVCTVMKLLRLLLVSLLGYAATSQSCVVLSENTCVSFVVGPGTGCSWMCNYCANTLGTPDYYFTTPVCTYEASGCTGNPVAGVSYTCCSLTHSP
jgi:hypothetical protein